MARTYCALEVDVDASLRSWCLAHSLSGIILKKLRQRGFYANFPTLEDLESHCIRFASDPDGETAARLAQPSFCFEESSPGPHNSQPEQVLRSQNIKNGDGVAEDNGITAEKPVTSFPYKELSADDTVNDWYIIGIDDKNIPIMQLPYDGSNVSSEPLSRENLFLGHATAEKAGVERWKLAITAGNELAIHVKMKMHPKWLRLGKPHADYEETIRNLLVYMHLFTIPTREIENSSSAILIHIQKKFDYWKVKPDASDVRESLLMMKKLNLCSLYPLDNQVLSKIEEETIGLEDIEADSDTKPPCIKRPRRHSSFESDIDHVPLSTRLHGAKETKSTFQTIENSVSKLKVHGSLDNKGYGKVDEARPIDGKQHTSGMDKIKERVRGILHDSFQRTMKTFPHGSNRTDQWGQRCVYSSEPFSAIDKLWNISSAAKKALDCLDQGGSVADAMRICPKDYLDDFLRNEVILKKYRVFQCFPSVSKQEEIAEKINSYVCNDDTVVEICTRTIDYFTLLREKLSSFGKRCDYKKYRIQQLQMQNKGRKTSINTERMPIGSKLLVCLTFSFSEWGEQSDNILDYTFGLKPKLIVIISPVFSRRLEEHSSYSLISMDSEILQNEALWPWGLMNIPSVNMEQKKGASPSLYVWSRIDWIAKHRHIASEIARHKSGGPRI